MVSRYLGIDLNLTRFNFRPAAQIVVQAERWCPCEREKVRNPFRFDSIHKISFKKRRYGVLLLKKKQTKTKTLGTINIDIWCPAKMVH